MKFSVTVSPRYIWPLWRGGGSKASVSPFVLPTEQLNQQEIQSHYINVWNHFNHLRALGWKRKTFTNDVQLWRFFPPSTCFGFCFRCCLNRTWNCLVKCTCEIWQPSQLNTANGCFYYTCCVNTDMAKSLPYLSGISKTVI